ncbi:MAG TPA: ABC transporter ATP-binding protein [Gammaproteobacteria bacterium]|nr:ABC transporter ATP-binding protein [Gammaproteobacteria bacterium]
MTALSFKGIHKTYAPDFHAIKGVTLNINQGDFFCLLGLNGAGKTTLIGIASGLIKKSSGIVSIFNHSLDSHPIQAKRALGLMPQETNLNPFDTVEAILVYQAGYYGISSATAMHSMKDLLSRLGLNDKRYSKVKELSGGMKRRLMLARALIHQPKILILDEPTAGVDIQLRHEVWNYLQELNQQGMTIILTTHYLEEAEFLCNNMAIIHHGKIIQQGSLQSIQASFNKAHYIIYTNKEIPQKVIEGANITSSSAQSLSVKVSTPEDLNEIISTLSSHSIGISHIDTKTSRLEEFFLDKTGDLP